MSYFDESFTLDDFIRVLDSLDSQNTPKFNRVPAYIEPIIVNKEGLKNSPIDRGLKNSPTKNKNTDLNLTIKQLQEQIQLKDEQIINMYHLLRKTA